MALNWTYRISLMGFIMARAEERDEGGAASGPGEERPAGEVTQDQIREKASSKESLS
jgi:hypothetical protein